MPRARLERSKLAIAPILQHTMNSTVIPRRPPASRLLALALTSVFTFAGSGLTAAAAPAAGPPPVPDLTKGGSKDENHDWNLGPTGIRGWVDGRAGHTADSRQILVTAVAKGSPADGILNTGDVILGTGGENFSGDARIQFANAITAAEQEKNGGLLRITRWREGKTDEVSLKILVLGSYSATAPYDCPKSRKILDLGCAAIARKNLPNVSIPNDLNALALLASGDAQYLPLVAEYARKVAEVQMQRDGLPSWGYGYHTLFLAEYATAAKEPSVMGGLRRLTGEIARGASAVGTWGHGLAMPNGNLGGYGSMNSPGLVMALALVIAREGAGLKDPDVDRVITKASGFLRWYVNKGAIPYGDHQPWPGHEDNGKCSNAAVLFDLLGDREATSFFARMSTAGYAERERGHTGNFFNMLWAMPGVARCGPLATGANWKELGWYYDLARGWDGSFGYQGSPAGEEEHYKYTNWDCTGLYMLAYALPLKKTFLTGKKPCASPPLDAKETAAVIADGRDYSSATAATCYDGRTTGQLMAGLASWSPAVRKRSAGALGKREGDFVPALLKMLDDPNRDARYGACEALANLGPKADPAAPKLRALLKDPDPWMQSLACQTLGELGPEARKASVSDLLAVTVRSNPSDPRRMVQRAAGATLFSRFPGNRFPRTSILAESLQGVDRELLYPAVRSVLENEDGATRGLVHAIYGKLTDQDLVELLPAIVKAVRDLAPSNEMFGDDIRLTGLDLLSRLPVREGMPLCVSVPEMNRWGDSRRLQKCMECLARYGAHAKAVLPELREMRRSLKDKNNNTVLLDKAIAGIEAATDSPTLVDLKDSKSRP